MIAETKAEPSKKTVESAPKNLAASRLPLAAWLSLPFARSSTSGASSLSTRLEALVFISAGLALFLLPCAHPVYRVQIAEQFTDFAKHCIHSFSHHWLFDPGFYIAIAITIALELTIPIVKGKKLLRPAVVHDILWTLFHIAMGALLMPICIIAIRSMTENSSLSILQLDQIPLPARWVIAFLIADFLAYVVHVWRHKSRVLWQFHAVHHSQRDLNFFSEARRHPVDLLVVYLRLYLPFYLLHLPFESIAATYIVRRWHDRINHINARTNFGLLRYILVTPQSHRVHHSVLEKHRDTNFGETLSIWDHIFGTQYRNYDEYPDTGVEDREFPLEQYSGTNSLYAHLKVIARQIIYPVRALFKTS